MNKINQLDSQNVPDSQDVPDEVWQKIREIADKSVPEGYIYRGEAEFHPKVCSGLYRPYLKSEIEAPDIMGSQNVILEEVRRYLPEISALGDDEILTQLQHYGCKTNLIDFTSDYLIALFFACEDLDSEDGRVILLERKPPSATYRVIKTLRTVNRVESQKSILVESPTGFVEPACIVKIPKGLKRPMRDFLERCHDISDERIYNDIHGFIKWQGILPDALESRQAKRAGEEREKAVAEKREKDAKAAAKKAVAHANAALRMEPSPQNYAGRARAEFGYGRYNSAAADFSKVIELDPENAAAYHDRGLASSEIVGVDGTLDAALEDYNKAIDLDPKQSIFYFERAIIRLRRQEWAEAKADLEDARNQSKNPKDAEDLGADFKRLFNQEIRDFEKRYDVVLPKDIAEMLT